LESGACEAVDPSATPDPAEIGLPIPGFDGNNGPRGYDGTATASVVDVTDIISADVVRCGPYPYQSNERIWLRVPGCLTSVGSIIIHE
jgi:hypothetical protein